jgi:phytoene dehydrogenase-like protein
VPGRQVVVVGSGPNGLSAAVALAREGHHVTVYEANPEIGGGASTRQLTIPGFHHDVCSAVHPMGVTSPFFRTLPLKEYGLEWIHPPILMAHPFDDGTAASLVRSVEATAYSMGSKDGPAYRRLMDPFVRNWEPLLADALEPPIHIPRKPILMARLGRFGFPPARTIANRLFVSDRARAFFLGIAAHVLLPMENAPTAAFGIMLALAGHAGGWPISRGGSQSISNALAGILRNHRGEVVTSSPITSLARFDRADAVVLDLTARQVLKLAADRLPSNYRSQLQKFRYGPGVFKIDWALSGPIPWKALECRQAGTIHLGASSDEIAESAAKAWYGQEDKNPFILLAQPSLFDPTRCPPGSHTAWAYCHVPHGSTTDQSEVIERKIERFAPGFRDLILARNTLNTQQLEAHNANLVGGDINGGVQDVMQLLFRPACRLDPYSTPAKGLFICSASTPPGGAVHGMCGYNASRSVLRYFVRTS